MSERNRSERNSRRNQRLLVRSIAIGLAASTAMLSAAPTMAQQAVRIVIPEQRASDAITRLARQTGMQILFDNDQLRRIRSKPVNAIVSPREALRIMLEGSGFEVAETPSGALVVRPPVAAPSSEGSDIKDGSAEQPAAEAAIVVTGTNIRGLQNSPAPVQIITKRDIEKSGYTSIEQVFRDLPQNLAEISFDATSLPQSDAALQNVFSRSASVSLRGLGPGSTLTLLNDKRRPSAVLGQAVDISVLPLAIVNRIEVVTGGQSAIYGSDAVAGVVNLITRKSFKGGETQFSYGGSNLPGGEDLRASQLVGAETDKTGILLAYEFNQGWHLDAVDTGLPIRFNVKAIYVRPDLKRHSLYLSGHHDFGLFDFYAEWLHSDRAIKTFSAFESPAGSLSPGSPFSASNATARSGSLENYGAAGLKFGLVNDWKMDFSANYGEYLNTFASAGTSTTGTVTRKTASNSRDASSLWSTRAVADGTLIFLRGRPLRAALGAEYRREGLHASPSPRLDRNVKSAFVELSVPLLSNLDISAAGRYDDFSDFGETFKPAGGIIFEPIKGLRFRGAYSKAFRAPDLFNLNRAFRSSLSGLPDPASPTGTSPVLTLGGGNPDLGPETATTWSVGADVQPTFAPWLRVSGSYFDVDYRNRLGNISAFGDTLLTLLRDADAGLYPGIVIRNPSRDFINEVIASSTTFTIDVLRPPGKPFDPKTQNILDVFPNLILFDNRIGNNARERVKGMDVSFNGRVPTGLGNLSFGFNSTYTFVHDRSVTLTSPHINLLNAPGRPVDFRARGNFGWDRNGFGVFGFVNYTDGYTNTLIAPFDHISSWTTADLTLQFDGRQRTRRSWIDDFMISLSFNNIFNKRPPTITAGNLGYDPVNADPIRRSITLNISKRW